MIVRFFYYYHLNLIYDLFIGWLNSGIYDPANQKLSFGNNILATRNFQVRDLDLQAMGRGGDGTEKNFGPMPIIRPYMNPVHPRVWKWWGALMRCPKALRTTLHVDGRKALILVYRFTYIAIWAILWQLALVCSRKRINILHYPFLLSHHAAIQ